METWLPVLRNIVAVGALNVTYYLVPAALVFGALIYSRRRWPAPNVVRRHAPVPGQLIREAGNSIRSSFIFATMFLGISLLLNAVFPEHYPQYKHIFASLRDQFGGWIYLVSIPLILIAYDAYFYWTHRLMHHRNLFGLFHGEHHRSHGPSSWGAQSFSVPEAVVNGGFLPLYAFAVPTDAVTATTFLILSVSYSAVVHSGLELFPRWSVTHPLLGWMNGTTHHDMHHGMSRSNYGLFFRLWDRLMGTEDPDFIEAFLLVKSPANAGDIYEVLKSRRRPRSNRPLEVTRAS